MWGPVERLDNRPAPAEIRSTFPSRLAAARDDVPADESNQRRKRRSERPRKRLRRRPAR